MNESPIDLVSAAKAHENAACVCLVRGPWLPETRPQCAKALRAWRKAGDRERARWFRYHISFIGYPLK